MMSYCVFLVLNGAHDIATTARTTAGVAANIEHQQKKKRKKKETLKRLHHSYNVAVNAETNNATKRKLIWKGTGYRENFI